MSSVEYSNTGNILESTAVDNDVHVKIQELMSKLMVAEQEKQQLEKEKQEMHDNFNVQRAKMQKLYLQKEEALSKARTDHLNLEEEMKRLNEELDEAKSELFVARIVKENEVEEEKRRAQVEIASLSRLVDETVEVSSSSQFEVKKLQMAIQTLQTQLAKMSSEKEKDNSLLVPSNVLSATKSLAKKVVSQFGSDADRAEQNLEDSMKKAKEDADVIRSLVVPLEEQISDLSERLRVSEERLRKYEDTEVAPKSSLTSKDAVSPTRALSCDMCANYEEQLQTHQRHAKLLESQKDAMEKNMEKFKEDLAKETQFRKEMEEKWNEKKEEQKLQINQLKGEMVCSNEEMSNLRQAFSSLQSDVKEHVERLGFDREKVNAQMIELQRQNDNLMGKHSAHAEALRNEIINFPDNIDELQVLLLDLREKLIAAKVAQEATEDEAKILRSEYQDIVEQLENERSANTAMETTLRVQSGSLEKDLSRLQATVEKLSQTELAHKSEKATMQQALCDILAENKKNKEVISELRTCIASLQQELDSSEMVQKDFVSLSQSLQIQLEKIRGADTEVRWQYEDDVIECPRCKEVFSSNKKKVHCRHCGHIFCQSCLPHAVPSGPNQRPSRVCEVCHTLLNRDSAPYFSQKPPNMSD